MGLLGFDIVLVKGLILYVYLDVVLLPEDGSTCSSKTSVLMSIHKPTWCKNL